MTNTAMEDTAILIDTETTGAMNFPLIYDFGAIIFNTKTFEVLEKINYFIEDMFLEQQVVMQSAYYKNKFPQYYKKIALRQVPMKPFAYVRAVVLNAMKKYNVKTVMAYNCDFDKKATNSTREFLTNKKEKYFFPYGTEYECIWNMACQTIGSSTDFVKWALANNKTKVKSGNIETSAEVMYQFLTGNTGFIEEHTALSDCEIELEIYKACMRFENANEIDRGIYKMCWRLPQAVRNTQEILELQGKI